MFTLEMFQATLTAASAIDAAVDSRIEMRDRPYALRDGTGLSQDQPARKLDIIHR